MKYALCLICVAMLIFSIVISIQPKNEITKIEFARSGAWSDRGAAFSVDTSLIYKYYGGIEGNRHYYVGRISRQFWDTLNRKLEAINYKTIDTTDHMIVADANSFELIVHWKNKKRRIVRCKLFNSADIISNTFNWLNNSNEFVKLWPVKETIRFETTFQDSPRFKVEQVKFPPPIYKKRG